MADDLPGKVENDGVWGEEAENVKVGGMFDSVNGETESKCTPSFKRQKNPMIIENPNAL
jgi:hypothetical protein